MSYSYALSDSLEWLKSLPRHSVHCFVTSPPYWALRSYFPELVRILDSLTPEQLAEITLELDGFTPAPRHHFEYARLPERIRQYFCAAEIGQEETLAEHLAIMVQIFAEVFRVLHPFGTLWLNYGDAWSQSGRKCAQDETRRKQFEKELAKNRARSRALGYPTDAYTYHGWSRASGTAQGSGLDQKQKLFLPHRVAMALQDSGWFVRDDCAAIEDAHATEMVWHKPNGKPQSIHDRPTKTHEYIFLLAKQPRYYYDDAAVTEPSGARLRSVWTINNVGTSDDHTATFPEELARRCILLGSNPFACGSCGMPYQPVYEEVPDAAWRRACGADTSGSYDGESVKDYSNGAETPSAVKRRILAGLAQRRHIDNVPACACIPSRVPSVVADMFGGTATTGVVALKHGRDFVGCEGSPKYHQIGSERLEAARLHVPVREHRNGQLSLLEEVI